MSRKLNAQTNKYLVTA